MSEIKCPSCWNKNVEQIDANEYRCPYCGTTFSAESELPAQEEEYDADDNDEAAGYNETDDGAYEEEGGGEEGEEGEDGDDGDDGVSEEKEEEDDDDDGVEGNTIFGKIAMCCYILAGIDLIGKFLGFSMIAYSRSPLIFGLLGVVFLWLEKKWNKG